MNTLTKSFPHPLDFMILTVTLIALNPAHHLHSPPTILLGTHIPYPAPHTPPPIHTIKVAASRSAVDEGDVV